MRSPCYRRRVVVCSNVIRSKKALGRPAFVRIGYEFNGRWNGYVPETYIPAWRRVVAAMRAHRLDDVAAVWCYASDIRNLPDLMDWYPGDEWVDWWSIDLLAASGRTNG